MNSHLLLYSANTWLAYAIAERFYGGVHYAWCSPCYDGTTAASHVNIPPTSSPAEIYRSLAEECRRGERHSTMIKRNREGIRKGAQARHKAGMITEATRAEIEQIASSAGVQDFRPVLFVMPFEMVRGMIVDVPVAHRAHPLSIEYRLEALPRRCFDMIELRS